MPEFEAEIALFGKTATGFAVPFDVHAEFGRHRPPVAVTINGYTYRSTIAKYGDDYLLPLNRENREAAGVTAGDRVMVRVELDTKPRVVETPADLEAALTEPARETWDALSFTHRREYVEWFDEAKRPETRQRRVAKAVEMLAEGTKAP
jgi:hypothetical protein